MAKIMIVEDEDHIRDMLKVVLQNDGFETFEAVDGNDFLDRVDVVNPDLVTLDVMMPGPSTREILYRLREKASKPRIILLTIVQFSDEDIRKVMQLGYVVDYILKPFNLEELLARVHAYV